MEDFYRVPDLPRQAVVLDAAGGPAWLLHWQQARQHAAAGEYEAALQKYELLLASRRNFVQPRWETAAVLLALHEFDRAAVLLETLIEEFPQHLPYLNALGYVMQERGHFARARELFQQAAQVDPENPVAISGLGASLLALGQEKKALPYLERRYARQPENLALREKLVEVYVAQRCYEQARPLAVQLAARPDATVDHLRTAAMIHAELKLDDRAEQYWRLVLARAPDDAQGHAWLADYLENEDRCAEALEHLLFLGQRNGGSPEILLRTGGCYLQIREPARALPYYEKYRRLFPDDREINRKLVNIYIALGDEAGTLTALDRYFQADPEPSPANLRRAARLYDEVGRYHDAIAVYRRLLADDPADAALLAALAGAQIATGDDEGALQTWSRLAAVTPDSRHVYRSMLELLARLDHPEQLLAVLRQLHRLEPQDDLVTLRLASVLIDRGELERGEAVFQEVAQKELADSALLRRRADIFARLQMQDHALRDYEKVLAAGGASRELHLQCLQLAAILGKLPQAHRHLALLQSGQISAAERLLVANAFRDGCDYDTAHALYRQMADDAALEPQLRRQALLELATSYETQGLAYEAEQTLRLALLVETAGRTEVLARIADLKLHLSQPREADPWLELIAAQQTASAGAEGGRDYLPELMALRRLNAEGKYGAAARRGEELLAALAEREGDAVRYRQERLLDLAALELARAFLGLKEYDEAARYCRPLADRAMGDFPALELLRRIYAAQGNAERAEAVSARMLELAGRDLGRMLALTGMYHDSGDHAAMVRAAQAARDMGPDSCSAAYWLAEAYSGTGRLAEARTLITGLQRDYPQNQAIGSLAARIAFVMGLNQEALGYCDGVLARSPERADMELLKGRIYWRKLEWKNSLQVYERYLTPAVSDVFRSRSAAAGVELPAEPVPSLWQRVTFSGPEKGGFFDQVMSPAAATSPGQQEMNGVAAPLFARYMWQRRFAAELAARRSVEQRDDFQAVNQFRELVVAYPQDESLLFDLAGIFSRMGKLGEEALLYERLAALDAAYPGLDEARERNRLKRLPRLDLTYHYQEENGWDGYKAIRKDEAQFGSWASVRAGSDVDVSLSRIRYSDVDSSRTLLANRALVAYDANIFNRFDLRLGGGLEDLEGEYDDAGLIECGLTGKVGDRLQGEFSYERDVVADTLASLGRGIVAENYRGGLFLGILPRLITGADYGYANYSDGNEIKGYAFWASYILFPEPTFLQFKFKYAFQDSRESGGAAGPLLADGFAALDHPYWTPANYWKNSYIILWKHKLSADTLERGTPSYYSAQYALDYDSQGHILQTVKGGFFLELTRNFMVESAVRFISSDEYRDRDFTLSAIYRW
jgi:tetratricopeptide (TPR) repeat protein